MSIFSVLLILLYYLGSNYIEYGYKSLQITAVYLGNDFKKTPIDYSFILFGFYCLYTNIGCSINTGSLSS